jgi:translation initiation factor 2B subunit (eIF-2B alpha/beta/delta family)
MTATASTHVVTCFLRHHGEVLLLQRSKDVGSYAGQWGAVAGHAEGDPAGAARAEIDEETGLGDDVTLVRAGEPFSVDDEALGTRWVVHPFLFDCARRNVRLNWETQAAEWTMPTEILRRDTVPQLWTSYERVAPTTDSIVADRMHGSAYIATRALEVLRDRAGVLRERGDAEAGSSLPHVARELLAARPAMAALSNRIHRVMQAAQPVFEPAEVEAEAHAAIAHALQADEATARHAAQQIAGQRVLTLSRSGTVLQSLMHVDPAPDVFVAESRPDREGVYVAETLARQGDSVTLITDAAIATVLARERIDAVLVGADTVLESGAVVNKTGTRGTALAARQEDVPLLVGAATDKITPEETPHLEEGAPTAVYDGGANLSVRNPTFDVTPADWVAGWITEEGVLSQEAVRERAKQHRQWSRWMERAGP